MAVVNLNAELELPSVIIDMPELQKMAARKKVFQAAMWSLAILIFSALSALIYLEITGSTRETVSADELEVKNVAQSSLKLTVQLVPENVQGAVVQVDGKVISGNPPYVYLEPTDDYHSIRIRAPGYRHMNKDVQVTSSEVVSFTLIPESARQVAAISVEELMAEELDTEGFDENSDDLIEEISPDAAGSPAGKKQKENARKLNNPSVQNEKTRKAVGGGKQIAAAAGAPANTPAGKSPRSAGKADAAATTKASKKTTVNGAAEEKSEKSSIIPSVQLYKPPKASLIINAPLGVTNRVAVSVDGQMRGYLPVLLKVDAGLHELTFVYDGHRTFQMVKLNAGQIVRIVPNL
jgi:hypothetical protein